jgi:putative acetyltransferase
MLTIVQISTLADIAAVRDLVREFTAWAFTLEPDSRDAPTFHDLERELAALPGDYAPPRGCFLLARKEGHPVGCVAFRATYIRFSSTVSSLCGPIRIPR